MYILKIIRNQSAEGGEIPRFSPPSVRAAPLMDFPFRERAVRLKEALGGESSLKLARLKAFELLKILDACFSFLIRSSCC